MSDREPQDHCEPSNGAETEPATEEAAPASLEGLQERLAEAEDRAAERDQYLEKLQRTLAEYHNYRRRVEARRERAGLEATESLCRDLLEVMDSLDRALEGDAGARDAGGLREGMELVREQLRKALRAAEVEEIATEAGCAFDPAWHDARATVSRPDLTPNQVVEVLARGYRIGDRLLRPAAVVVAVAPAGEASRPEGEGIEDGEES